MKSQALALAAAEFHQPGGDLNASPIQTMFFKKWQFWRVTDNSMPPLVSIVATNGDRAVKLSITEGFSNIVSSEPVHLADANAATQYIDFFVSVADPSAIIVNSVNDIPGITDGERHQWAGKISRPAAHRNGQQYIVDMWTWKNEELCKGKFAIDSRGAIKPHLAMLPLKIGVSISIE